MQTFVANVTGKAERKTLDGREYIVVPVSMIVPGVLAGSKGPLYYPQSRVARNASEWDGVHVTLGHPSDPVTNEPLSASDPGVVDRVGMGVLRNSKFTNGKLRAEAWLEESRVQNIAPQVHAAALNGRLVEVSTGLFTQEVERAGTHNGRSYTHEVVDYRPDHLAILTDQRGACSLQDGCGMNVHNAEQITVNNACPCGGTCRVCVNAAAMPKSTKAAKPRPTAAAGSAEAQSRVDDYNASVAPAPVANDDEECQCGGKCESCKMAKNEKVGCEGETPTGDDYVPQPRCPVKQTFQPRGFKGKGRGEAHVGAKKGFNGEPVEGSSTTSNSITVDRGISGLTNQGEPTMDRKQMIEHLTTNCNCYKGKAGGVLNAMTDEQLEDLILNAQVVAEARKLVPGGATLATNAMPAALMAAMKAKQGEEEPEEEEDDEEEAPVMNKPTKNAKTPQEWLRDAPKPIRTLVENALNAEREAKEQLVETLTANVSDDGAKAALRKTYFNLPIKVLQAQVAAMPTNNSSEEFDLTDLTANYGGAGLSSFDHRGTTNRISGLGEITIEEPVAGYKN